MRLLAVVVIVLKEVSFPPLHFDLGLLSLSIILIKKNEQNCSMATLLSLQVGLEL